MSNELGIDRSGNGNNWTVNNITYSDQVVDSPTNNFATIDPLSSGNGSGVISEGNLKYVTTAKTGVGTQGISSGKAYFEVTVSSASNSHIGICDIGKGINPLRGGNWSDHGGITYKQNGDQYRLPVGGGSSTTVSYGASYTNGDIIGVALDVDNNTIKFYKNNVSQGNTAQGPSFISSNGVYSIMIYGGSDMIFTVNFGQDSSFAGAKTAQGNQDGNNIGDFYYTPPTGFLALCTKNLPDVDVVPSEHFNTVLYNGTNSSQSITGVGFQPDFTWIKHRQDARDHMWFDAVRGATKYIISNKSDAEATTSDTLTSFDSDGFSLGADLTTYDVNESGGTPQHVAWNWKANGSGSSNTNGSITSTVSANVDAGFSIVSYTGNLTAGATIGHGLSSAPEMMIVKERGYADSWAVYHTSVGNTKLLHLNTTVAERTHTTYWNDTSPTSSVFSVGSDNKTNGDYAAGMIASCFHSVDGYSKVGSYTGNSSADGTFVNTNFAVKWVLIKNTTYSSGTDWYIWDKARDPYNSVYHDLTTNSSAAEDTDDGVRCDFLSNGFKLRHSSTATNNSSHTYIYLAFAETPFKYSNGK